MAEEESFVFHDLSGSPMTGGTASDGLPFGRSSEMTEVANLFGHCDMFSLNDLRMTADTFQLSNSLDLFKMFLVIEEDAFLVLDFSREKLLGMTVFLQASIIFNTGDRPGIVVIGQIFKRVQHISDGSEFMAFQAVNTTVIGGEPLIIIGLHIMAGFA